MRFTDWELNWLFRGACVVGSAVGLGAAVLFMGCRSAQVVKREHGRAAMVRDGRGFLKQTSAGLMFSPVK